MQVIAENNLWIVQRAFVNLGGSASIADVAGGYVRYCRNGTWTAWQKLVTEGSATAIRYVAPLNGGTQIQVARTGSRVYRVSMFRNANTSVAVVDQWGAVAYIVNTGSFVITADSTNITIKNNSGAYCNVVVEEM